MECCEVTDCDKPKRGKATPYCSMHYFRVYRNGSIELKPKNRKFKPDKPKRIPDGWYVQSGGYIVLRAEDHPLMTNKTSPYEYEHRLVYYDAYGEGPFDCHCCGKSLAWDMLHVDHLNDDKQDNRLENLAPACPLCNQARGYDKVRATQRAKGVILELNGVRKCVSVWSVITGLSRPSIMNRLRNGWSVEATLTKPRGKFGPKGKAS